MKKTLNWTFVIVALILGVAIVLAAYLNVRHKEFVFEAEQQIKTENQALLRNCLKEINQRSGEMVEIGSLGGASKEDWEFVFEEVNRLRNECYKIYGETETL